VVAIFLAIYSEIFSDADPVMHDRKILEVFDKVFKRE
jgi:hypothetical protein